MTAKRYKKLMIALIHTMNAQAKKYGDKGCTNLFKSTRSTKAMKAFGTFESNQKAWDTYRKLLPKLTANLPTK
jgi:hypothetical protein